MAGEGPVVPAKGSLAALLEADALCRRRLLVGEGDPKVKTLTQWPCKNTIGVKSVKAMLKNTHLLEIVARWWAPTTAYPRALTIDLLRQEAESVLSVVPVPLQ